MVLGEGVVVVVLAGSGGEVAAAMVGRAVMRASRRLWCSSRAAQHTAVRTQPADPR